MIIHSLNINEIEIQPNRQRRTMEEEDILKLSNSISQLGLIHPVVIRQEGQRNVLVAGERRIKAMTHLWFFGQGVRVGETEFPIEEVPCIFQGEMSSLDAMEMELEENIRRVDLSWQDRAKATAELAELKRERASAEGRLPPTIEEIAAETHGTGGESLKLARAEILVTPHLDDPEVAGATNAKEALKILRRKEDHARYASLARSIGAVQLSSLHSLHQGNCFDVLAEMQDSQFDVVLTDPPYGIDADNFGDSAGRVAGAHFYDDSFRTWNTTMRRLAPELWRVTKPSSHIYIFTDIDNFLLLKGFLLEAGFRVFRTPLVWVNPTAMRAPWPEHGPQRKYQVCVFAVKGDRTVNRLAGDVLTYPSDENLGHHAQKPLALYRDLLSRSANPGDSVLDPFGGTGPIIPAAHELKCKATYIEQDAAAFGIASSRLKELK